MFLPFKKSPPKGKWIQPDSQWGVGDKCCRVGCQDITGNAPPKNFVLTVSDVFEGVCMDTKGRSVGLHFSNWPQPINSDIHGWAAVAFRKVDDAKKAEETSIGEKILKAKPAPEIKRTTVIP